MKIQSKAISDKAVKYFDDTAFELLQFVFIKQTLPNAPEKPVASIVETEKMTFSNVQKIVETTGNAIYEIDKGQTVGFSESDGEKFQKFVRNVHRTSPIQEQVSKQFVETLTFQWLITTKVNGKADCNFSSHLLTKIDESLRNYKVFHLIHLLYIDKPFNIGNVEIGFFTREYFRYFTELPSNLANKKDYEEMTKDYAGTVYAMCQVRSETDRAKEIAFKKCSLAVDVLKICSDTLVVPQYVCSFEIDIKLNRNIRNEVIVEEQGDPRELMFNLYGPGKPVVLDDQQMLEFRSRDLETFSQFLLTLEGETSELQDIIVQSIQRLSRAFSEKDLHQRIAEIVSILEAVLLMNDTGNLMDSVCKYLCRLLHKDLASRESSIKLYKDFYAIRSAWVHHAKRDDFMEVELSILQRYAHRILVVLIHKTKSHATKESVLLEIDRMILSA